MPKHANYPWVFIGVLLLLFGRQPISAQQLDNIQNEKPFSFHGSINNNLILAHSSGSTEQTQPFSYILSGNFNASIYGLSLPFSFTLSDQQRNYCQPFNQFGLSPSYKWITLHAGYRNVRFSDFTLGGHTFTGVGIELNPGKFRFGFISGRFNRSTYTNDFNPTIDSLPEYKRKGLALKLGVGGKKTFVDLIILRIQDDTASFKGDPGDFPNRTPEQNLVTGLNSKIAFSKYLTFEGEGAISIYTTNMYAAKYDSSESSLVNKFSDIILINQSTLWFTAFRTSLFYKKKDFSTKLEFRRIDPGYKSLGAYYFNSDIRNITVSPAFALWKRKMMVRGSLGLQRDNLRNTKKVTSLRTIGSLAITINPSQVFGVDAQYNNFSTNQKAGRSPVTDTSKVYQATQTLSITPRLTFIGSKQSQMIMLMLNRTRLNDNNPVTQNLTENTSTVANLNYILSLFVSRISLSAGLTYLGMKSTQFENTARGITAGVSRMFAKQTLSVNWSNSLLFTKYLDEKGKVFTTSIGMNYQLKKQHQFRLNTYFTGNYYPTGSAIKSFNQIKGDLGYVFTF
jgi:hypothetical protein